MSKNYYSTDKNNWNNYWNNAASAFTKISWSKRRICHILDQYIKSQVIVLDAGSGSGFFSNYFIGKNCKTYSLDYSEAALQLTRTQTKNKSDAYLLVDLLDPNFGKDYSNTFDIIFSDGLLEHFSVEHQKQIIQNWKAVKKEQGIVVTFVPNKHSAWELIRPYIMPGIEEVPFTLSELEKLYQAENMNIMEKGGLNTIPFAFSPDRLLGKWFGMLLYIIVK